MRLRSASYLAFCAGVAGSAMPATAAAQVPPIPDGYSETPDSAESVATAAMPASWNGVLDSTCSAPIPPDMSVHVWRTRMGIAFVAGASGAAINAAEPAGHNAFPLYYRGNLDPRGRD